MYILSQLPISMPEKEYSNYYQLLYKAYELTKEKDTQVTIKDVPKGFSDPSLLNYYGLRQLNGQEMVRSMLQAEESGFDAIAGACYFDTGIKTVSNILSIPVIGPAIAAMNIASMIGENFAVITTESLWIPELEHFTLSSDYGGKSLRWRPIRALNMSMGEIVEDLLRGQYEKILEDFYSLSNEAIAQGAEVIIAGCGLISPIFTIRKISQIDGVPIIDPMVAGLKLAEFMVHLKESNMAIKSERGRFANPPLEIQKKGLKWV